MGFLLNSVSRNTFWQALGKISTLIVSLFFITPLLTSYLGEGGYGVYAFITALVLFFGSVSDWGTNIIGVREASSRSGIARVRVIGTTVFLRLLLSVVAVMLLNIALRLNAGWEHLVFAGTIASFVLVFLSLKTSFGIVFQTLLKFEFSAISELFATLVLLAGVLYVRAIGGGLDSLMFAWIASAAGSSLLAFIFVRQIFIFTLSFDKTLIKRVFWESAPTGALLVIFAIYNRVDIIILEYFKTDVDVGIYALPYRIYDNVILGAAFLMNALFPLFSKYFKQKGASVLKVYYQASFSILLLTGVVLGILLFAVSPALIGFLGQGGFTDSSIVLKILSVGLIFGYLNHLTGYSLIAFERQKLSLLIAVFALTFNVVLNIIFIPAYSYVAAAYITVLTEALVFVFSSIVIWRIFGFYPTMSLRKAIDLVKRG